MVTLGLMSSPTYLDALRTLLETHAKPVEFMPPTRWCNPEVPEVSAYNDWLDYPAFMHAGDPAQVSHGEGCGWIVESGAQVTEDTYTEWGGTFGEDTHTVGINVTPARCHCGQYTNMTLRYEKSLSQTLRDLLGVSAPLLTL